MSATTAHARLAALALSCAWGIIAMSTGINALAKSNAQKRALKHDVPAAVSVRIDTDDVLDSGIVVTVVCALIALVSFLALLHALVFRLRIAKRSPDHRADAWRLLARGVDAQLLEAMTSRIGLGDVITAGQELLDGARHGRTLVEIA